MYIKNTVKAARGKLMLKIKAASSDERALAPVPSRDVPIPFFPSRYRFRYLDSGYRPIPSTDPIPGCVSIQLQFILALYELIELFYGVLQTYPLGKHEQIHVN